MLFQDSFDIDYARDQQQFHFTTANNRSNCPALALFEQIKNSTQSFLEF